MGLIDVNALRRSDEAHGYDEKKSGVKANWSALEAALSGACRPLVGGMSALSRPAGNANNDAASASYPGTDEAAAENAYKGRKNQRASYANGAVTAA
jgi:hypothetical protein